MLADLDEEAVPEIPLPIVATVAPPLFSSVTTTGAVACDQLICNDWPAVREPMVLVGPLSCRLCCASTRCTRQAMSKYTASVLDRKVAIPIPSMLLADLL